MPQWRRKVKKNRYGIMIPYWLWRYSKWGWITKLPEGSHPELNITAQRIRVWDTNGRYMSVIKGIQKEM